MAVLSAGRRNHNVDQRRSKMSVEPALKKLEEDALDLQGMATKYWIDGAPVGFIVPGQYQQAVVTAYFIQAAERFDDELESLIAKEYPNADSKLASRRNDLSISQETWLQA